jgi:hypothetical protein
MRYKFTTSAKVPEKVEIDRNVITGKVKVYVDRKQVGSSHHGTRGAAGTYYPLKSGTLEVRSGLFEIVPRVWYNEDWVELAPPVRPWMYMVAALPLLSAFPWALSPIPWIVALLAFLINWFVLRSQRPTSVRIGLCFLTAVICVTLNEFIYPAFVYPLLIGGQQ